MNAIRNKTIAIVGAGPVRRTLARLLQMSGAEIKVYERDLNRNAGAQGATLDLHEESGLKALREAGLMEEFEANYHLNEDFSDGQSATAAYEKQMLVRAALELLRSQNNRWSKQRPCISPMQFSI